LGEIQIWLSINKSFQILYYKSMHYVINICFLRNKLVKSSWCCVTDPFLSDSQKNKNIKKRKRWRKEKEERRKRGEEKRYRLLRSNLSPFICTSIVLGQFVSKELGLWKEIFASWNFSVKFRYQDLLPWSVFIFFFFWVLLNPLKACCLPSNSNLILIFSTRQVFSRK
jgi:hypothetical protein